MELVYNHTPNSQLRCDTKITKLDLTILRDQDIAAFDISMNDSGVMYVFECHGQLSSNRDDVLLFKPRAWSGFHERMNTTAWTKFQRLDFFPKVFDGLVLLVKIQLVVQIVDINDLHSHKVLDSPFVHSAKGSLSNEFKKLIVWNGSVCSCSAVNDHLVHVLCILDLLLLCTSADRRERIQKVSLWGQTVRYCRESAEDALLARYRFVPILPVQDACSASRAYSFPAAMGKSLICLDLSGWVEYVSAEYLWLKSDVYPCQMQHEPWSDDSRMQQAFVPAVSTYISRS
ncbi:kinase-like protein, partial [Aureobasidium melanogenum]